MLRVLALFISSCLGQMAPQISYGRWISAQGYGGIGTATMCKGRSQASCKPDGLVHSFYVNSPDRCFWQFLTICSVSGREDHSMLEAHHQLRVTQGWWIK
ncbi:hypothetical protein F4780DRAFT_501637 [Xylariomycetidae sp. FL0641]|nr:hypothetical protein F4780DRAFT_501637 [Xylariomycetidae sp. FL0641]